VTSVPVSDRYSGVVVDQLLVEGPIPIRVRGVLQGGAVVTGRLELDGVCPGPLDVLEGGRAEVAGVVSGPLRISDGGVVQLRGVVSGPLQLDPDGRLVAAVGAIIAGEALEADGVFRRLLGAVVVENHAPLFERRPDGTWTPVGG